MAAALTHDRADRADRADRLRRARARLPLCFPLAMGLVLALNAIAFRHYQDPRLDEESAYRPLQVHDPDPRPGWRPRTPPRLAPYYWMQDLLRGTEFVLPPHAGIRAIDWEHVALVTLRPGGRWLLRPRWLRAAGARRLELGKLVLLFAEAPEALRGRTVRLVPSRPRTGPLPGREVFFVVSERALRERGRRVRR